MNDMRKLMEAVENLGEDRQYRRDQGEHAASTKGLKQTIMDLRAGLEHITMLSVYKASDENVLNEINVYARELLDSNQGDEFLEEDGIIFGDNKDDDPTCDWCGGEMQWCPICTEWTKTCCQDYGTCQCS